MKKVKLSTLIILLFLSVTAFSQKINLQLGNLKCNKTTEMGEDEVYFILTAVKSDIRPGLRDSKKEILFSKRLPSNDTHWDLNDGSHSNSILQGFDLSNLELESGYEVTFLLTIMEEDGGVPSNYLDTIAIILASTGDPDAAVVAGVAKNVSTVLRIFKVKDTDDIIGQLMITVARPLFDENLVIKYIPVDRVFAVGDDGIYKAVNFRGDGSDYTGWFNVTKKE